MSSSSKSTFIPFKFGVAGAAPATLGPAPTIPIIAILGDPSALDTEREMWGRGGGGRKKVRIGINIVARKIERKPTPIRIGWARGWDIGSFLAHAS